MAFYSVNLFLQTKSECFEKDIYIYIYRYFTNLLENIEQSAILKFSFLLEPKFHSIMLNSYQHPSFDIVKHSRV